MHTHTHGRLCRPVCWRPLDLPLILPLRQHCRCLGSGWTNAVVFLSRSAGGLWHPEAQALSLIRHSIDKHPKRLKGVLTGEGFATEFFGKSKRDEKSRIGSFVAANSADALKTAPKVYIANSTHSPVPAPAPAPLLLHPAFGCYITRPSLPPPGSCDGNQLLGYLQLPLIELSSRS